MKFGVSQFVSGTSACIVVCLLAHFTPAHAAERPLAAPYEKLETAASREIDKILEASLASRGLEMARTCSDAVFVRRVYLDAAGTLPDAETVKKFLEDDDPGKRGKVIDKLLESNEYVDYWTLKWCDLLRVKAEYPINLWPNAVQAYHRWIRESIAANLSYDKFARSLLTSNGSNFRVPQVNFYRAVQGREPATLASAAALTFMGVRTEKMPEKDRRGLEAFFSRVGFKGTAEWKEEIVYFDTASEIPSGALFPNGKNAELPSEKDPRKIFADWLISPDNPWFSRNIVNRMWSWTFGRGLIHEPDDIREDKPPVHPKLLEYLEREFVKSGYDLKHIFRLLFNSRAYQQSSITGKNWAEAEKYFACYPVRRLDAEVMIDALHHILGGRNSYQSPVPEPFSFVPEEHRSINLADGSITSQFLEMFGRPPRDTGLESERNNNGNDAQRLHMLNSSHIQDLIKKSWKIRKILRSGTGNRKSGGKAVENLYLHILSRLPTEQERRIIAKHYTDKNKYKATCDLVWALINTREFQFRH